MAIPSPLVKCPAISKGVAKGGAAQESKPALAAHRYLVLIPGSVCSFHFLRALHGTSKLDFIQNAL